MVNSSQSILSAEVLSSSIPHLASLFLYYTVHNVIAEWGFGVLESRIGVWTVHGIP